MKKSLSFSKYPIAFDYQKVRNQNQGFHLECGTNKKKRKGDTVGHKRPLLDCFCVTAVVLHFSQMCYTMN
ncbi:MAG: hypothetical protein IJP36_01585, partial [Bacteroides sp.]|nr:hypothetical protein [Bacteroides sp.]